MVALVLATSTLFMYAARDEIVRILYREQGARLHADALQVAELVEASAQLLRERVRRMSADPALTRFLTEGAPAARVGAAEAALARLAPPPRDSALLRIQVLRSSGAVAAQYVRRADPPPAGWTTGRVAEGTLPTDSVSLSPLLADGTSTLFEVAAPVLRNADDPEAIGWVVETRRVAGGGDAIRRLIGASMLLFGDPRSGVWSDLERAVPAPPAFSLPDSFVVFDSSARGAGVGSATSIAGTPWMVWVEAPRT